MNLQDHFQIKVFPLFLNFQEAFSKKVIFLPVCLITKKNQDYSFSLNIFLDKFSRTVLVFFSLLFKLTDKLNKWQYDNMNVLYVHNVSLFFNVAIAVGKLTDSNHSTNMAQKLKK